MSSKYQRYENRLRDLIDEGKEISTLERPSDYSSPYIQGDDQIRLQAWLVKASNIIGTVFGSESPHVRHFNDLTKNGASFIAQSDEVVRIVGLLDGALNDLENGFLIGQEFLIAAEIFDSVLVQAKHLNQSGHKDPAAVLARVVLEDSLRRLASQEGLDETQSAGRLNDDLRGKGRYAQPQWRLIQAWLDIGNAAAHGKFSDYTDDDVQRLVEDIERFLATEFR